MLKGLSQIVRRLSVAAALLGMGCDRVDMDRQPHYAPLEPSGLFPDGTSARPLVAGTVTFGAVKEASGYETGWAGGAPLQQAPVQVTMETLKRGQERFNIYCSPCHGLDGYGEGIIVQRGFTPPPSFHIERLRLIPDGYIFSVITDGLGRMPSYAQQVKVEDRWAIVAYIRALQLSQRESQAPPSDEARPAMEGRPNAR